MSDWIWAGILVVSNAFVGLTAYWTGQRDEARRILNQVRGRGGEPNA